MKPARFLRQLCAQVLLWMAPLAAFAAMPWADAPYTQFANNSRIDSVLADFASSFSLSLSVQPDVQGMVSGRFATANPTEFLNKLAGMYGFTWYTHAGTLFVSRSSDVVTRGISAPGGNVVALRKALTDLGVLEPRFGWGELADGGMVLLSGPATYVNLVESTIRNLPARSQTMMVFRLQHASAVDRTVSFRDQQIVTPGLASILRAAVSGGGIPMPTAMQDAGASGGGVQLRPATQLADLSAGTMAKSPGAQPPSLTQQFSLQAAGGAKASIQADPRLNALIIQDLPERMPVYQQLIAQLDVPAYLVEIEAMIVDVSSDRASELGVDWTGRIGKSTFSFGQQPTSGGGNFSFTSGSTAAGNFLISQLRALQTSGDAEVRSKPSVLTAENLQAVLDLSETFYIRSQGERVASVTPVTAGTTLRVTPHVLLHAGKVFVRLQLDIEDGQIANQQVDALPIVTRTSVSTEATVQQGESLLIAGYTTDRNLMSKTQLPVLGDLPVVGQLFSNRSRTVQKRERMFLIRPKVVELSDMAKEGEPNAR